MEVESFEESEYIFDNYNHLNPGVYYSVTRIPGKDVPDSDFQYFECGCDCSNSQCTEKNNCSCLKYGVNYRLTDGGLILEGDKFGNVPVFECNSQCSCFEKVKSSSEDKLRTGRTDVCPNRNVQFGPIGHLEIFDAGAKGLGLKTNRKIPSGAFICEYAGEVIGLEEAKRRQKRRAATGDMNYIFILKEFRGDDLCGVTCVDPTHVGNIGRYINHSCHPNSAIVPVRVNDAVPWICVFAVRDIDEGEEICYDYSGHGLDGLLEESPDRKLCLCGAVGCKKFLPFENKV